AGLTLEQHVEQQQCKPIVPHDVTGAPHGVPQTEWLLLPGEAGVASRGQILAQFFECCGLAAQLERGLELKLPVEMILDHALVATSDENEVLDAGLAR